MNTALWTVSRRFGAKRAAQFLPPRHRVISVTADKKRGAEHLLIEGALCPPPIGKDQPASVSLIIEDRAIGALSQTVLVWFAHDPLTQWLCAADA